MNLAERILLLITIFGLAYVLGNQIRQRRRFDTIRDQVHNLSRRINKYSAEFYILSNKVETLESKIKNISLKEETEETDEHQS